MSSGFNAYLGLLGISPTGLRIYYDFNQSTASGDVVPSVPSGQGLYSGQILPSTGSFYSISGSGFFTAGRYIQIKNPATGLNSKQFTHIFDYEKTVVGDAVLFSSFTTGLVGGLSANLGYVIGINAANQLYFASHLQGQPDTRVLPTPLNNRGIIAIARFNNLMSLSTYDYSQEKLISKQFNINTNCLFDGTGWYLGQALHSPPHFTGSNFTGYLDNYLYLNKALNPTDLKYLLSGGGSDSAQESIGVNKIVYLTDIDSSDFTEIYAYSGRGLGSVYNNVATFDSTRNRFKLNNLYTNSTVNIYANGLGQLPSGYSVTGGACVTGFVLSGNYLIVRDGVESTGFYNSSDTIIYDSVTGNTYYNSGFSHGATSGEKTLAVNPNDFYFLNGQKLVSGTTGNIAGGVANYYPSGANIIFPSGYALYSGITGMLFSIPANTWSQRTTGYLGNITLNTFAERTSLVFRNGVRQLLDSDYVEISTTSLLSGTGLFFDNLEPIYDGNSLFLE